MKLDYKVYVKDAKAWELIASFAVLDHAVNYALEGQMEDGRAYKVMNKRRNVHVFE